MKLDNPLMVSSANTSYPGYSGSAAEVASAVASGRRRKKEAQKGTEAYTQASQEYKDAQKAQDDYEIFLRKQGYALQARPYEFDESAWKSPYLQQQLADIKAGKKATTAQIAAMAEPQKEFRDTQSALISQLMAASQGQGPSLVQSTFRSSLDKAIAANRAGALASGVSPAQAARMQSAGMSAIAPSAANQAAQLAAQEQLSAREQLAKVAESARAQDLTLATNQQNFMNDMTKYYMSLGMDQQNAQYLANVDLQKSKAEQHQQAQALRQKVNEAGSLGFGKVMGAVGGALGGLAEGAGAIMTGGASLAATTAARAAAAGAKKSDKNLKENIKNADKDISQFLKALAAKKYNFKPEANEKSGQQFGILAQDLEKSEAGKSAVVDSGNGYKGYDIKAALGLALAGLGNLNKRLAKMERK